MALSMVAESSPSFGETDWGLTRFSNGHGGLRTCNGAVGDCINAEEEMMMDSETSRRLLAQGKKYISYGALKKNTVPCNRRGASYYNCKNRGKANPYRRGCSKITHCDRTNG
jgi:hypothetical protein